MLSIVVIVSAVKIMDIDLPTPLSIKLGSVCGFHCLIAEEVPKLPLFVYGIVNFYILKQPLYLRLCFLIQI